MSARGGAVAVLWTAVREEWDDTTRRRTERRVPAALLEHMPNYRRWQDVQMGLAGKLLLARCLADAGIDPCMLDSMRWSDSGRPSLPIGGDFNLSHSDGVVVCALSPTARIGIDIELIDRFPVRDIDQVLNDGERAAIDRAADPAREWCRVWTFKEAVIKADGRGVAAGLERIDSHSSTVKLDEDSWHVQPVALHPEFCCHLASGSIPIDVDVHEIMLDALLGSG